jgi:hypothetical protein
MFSVFHATFQTKFISQSLEMLRMCSKYKKSKVHVKNNTFAGRFGFNGGCIQVTGLLTFHPV